MNRCYGQTERERFENASIKNRRLLRQEELILDVTEQFAIAMEQDGVSRTELAKRLGKTKGFVSQVLSGRQNVTLRTLADFSDALGRRAFFQVRSEHPANRVWASGGVPPAYWWNTSSQPSPVQFVVAQSIAPNYVVAAEWETVFLNFGNPAVDVAA